MGAFLGISLWVALATVIPGLITIAAASAAIIIVSPDFVSAHYNAMKDINSWIGAGFAVTVMVLTQAFGILLEKILVDRKMLGPDSRKISIAKGIDPHGRTSFTLHPYFEYQGLYILLAELREEEDTQGHLKRVLAQYFLTNNSLVAFSAGIIVTIISFVLNPSLDSIIRTIAYIAILAFFLFISFKVAVIRFEVMAKALWAARRRRLTDAEDETCQPPQHAPHVISKN